MALEKTPRWLGGWLWALLMPMAMLCLGLPGCSEPRPALRAVPRWAADSATVQLAAGPQYARGAVWRFFLGVHYRDLWAASVTVPVLRLGRAELDSLIPLQAGGSYQSRTLRLLTKSGHQMVLRSVDKDMSVAIPAGWRRTLLRTLMKDQTSATQPYGAYVAACLAEAAGVYHANPRLVYLPDDLALGKYRAGYANALYLLEERAEGNQQTQASFGNSPAIVNSRNLLLALRQRPSEQVEPRTYLRARLLDMWLGDWSRREDQWRWASFPRAGRTIYRPIPRDRDQAFFLFDDGALTRVVSWFLPKFQTFRASITTANVEGLTITARALDRTLLSSLSADDFGQVADSLCQRLTDAVIADALTAGPAETRAGIAARLAPLLRARRAQLPAMARRYYELLVAEAWVVGTDQAERFVLEDAGPGNVRVRMLAVRPAKADSLILEQVYKEADTRQVNLYGLAGNDVFEVRLRQPAGIAIHLFAGMGTDRILSPINFEKNAVFWHLSSKAKTTAPAGIQLEADPHPELTGNAFGWLTRYKLPE